MMNGHKENGAPPIRVPGPPFTAKLSLFDARHVGFFSRRVLIFRSSKVPSEVVPRFTEALGCLVHKVPALGGEIYETESGPTPQDGWKDIRLGAGIALHVKDLTSSLHFDELEATNFAPEKLPDNELMPLSPANQPLPCDAAHFQLNFIKGGILLGVCINHLVADGTSDTEILRLFASYFKALQEPEGQSAIKKSLSKPVGLDRTPLRGLKSSKNSLADHPAMFVKAPGEEIPLNWGDASTLQSLVVKIYRIRGPALAQLKADATSQRISSNDAIQAVLWRALLINKIASGVLAEPSDDEQTTFAFPVSSRRVLKLGDDYIGNAVCNRCCTLPLKEVLKPNSLQQLAATIRAEINRVDRELVSGYAQIAESCPNVTDFHLGIVPHLGGTGILFTSFLNSTVMFQDDWGELFGHHLVRIRCTDRGFAGFIPWVNFVLPKMPGDAGCEVEVHVHSKGLAAMEEDEVFRKYFEA